MPLVTDINDPLSQINTAVDDGIAALPGFSAEAIDAAQKLFRRWHVEPLLDQAADLLDRCLRDRASYDDLRARYADLVLRVTGWAQTDLIRVDEVAAGSYAQDYILSSAQAASYQAVATNSQHSIDTLSALSAPTGPLYPTSFNNASPSNQTVTNLEFETTFGQVTAQALATQGEVQSTTALAAAFQRKSAFDALNYTSNPAAPGFRDRRDAVARQIIQYTDSLMTGSGLAYNYREKSQHLKKRFLRDFRDAYVRLCVAETGLQQIYGTLVPGFPAIGAASMFDDSVTWVRDAIRYLAGFCQLDQCYVLSISVRKIIGDAQWNAAVNAVPNPTFNFFFDEVSQCPNQRYVRMRGVGACVVGGTGPWQISVKLPAESVVHYAVSDNNGNLSENLDQPDVPPVRLGRVLPRTAQLAPDVSGVASLRNVSPLSRDLANAASMWTVTILGSASHGEQAAALQDLQLDLQLVMQSA